MRSLEDVFVKEFREATSMTAGYKDIYSIPLPKVSESWEVSGTELYAVKGIEEEYYEKLNLSLVKKLPRDKVAKRRKIDKVTRSFKKDDKGEYIYEDYKVPEGSIVVLSDKQIDLPYSMYLKNTSGYGYIDFVGSGDKIQYMYVLPKSVLYRVNQTALVLSVKSMKSYAGKGYQTWNNGVIFLHVIPYSPNAKYVGSKVLKTGTTINYLKEIDAIVSYWESNLLIPSIKLSELQTGVNLALKSISISYDSYIPIEPLPISDKEIFGSEGGI